jgi:hypothetical protein
MELSYVVCGACGTMHQMTDEEGICQVIAFPGPVRAQRMVSVRDVGGDLIETPEWDVTGEMLPSREHPGGIAALDQFACVHCGQKGRMLTVKDLRAPAGRYREAECPVCKAPLEGVGVSDWI